MTDPAWRIGVEIELLAPRGLSRRDLAERVAGSGSVRRFFHPQSEPSAVPGIPVMENLTIGFAATTGDGRPIARFVDDLTLQDDLDRAAPPKPGWWRIVGDDGRMLRLLARHSDPHHDLPELLDRFAALFGTRPEGTAGMWRVADEAGASIVVGAPLPGERERPCEIVTVPLESDHHARVEALLRPARDLEFSIPAEGAVHLHFDATPFASARAVSRLVRWWCVQGDALKSEVGTNPRCRRLGPPPPELVALVEEPRFEALAWPVARQALQSLRLTKWVDLNIRNLVHETTGKYTIEVRIFPPVMRASEIVGWMGRMVRIFRGILDGSTVN